MSIGWACRHPLTCAAPALGVGVASWASACAAISIIQRIGGWLVAAGCSCDPLGARVVDAGIHICNCVVIVLPQR
jgi:hypothetical protein